MDRQTSFVPKYLSEREVNYELSIRRIRTCRSLDERRRLLKHVLVKECAQPIPYTTEHLSFETDQAEIIVSLEEITTSIVNLDRVSPCQDTCQNILSRLSHVKGRILRTPIPSVNIEECKSSRDEVYATYLMLEADFEEIVPQASPTVTVPEVPAAQSVSRPSLSKNIPVYKWDVSFSGNPDEDVLSFLERVEELSTARGVDGLELFASAVDLFKDRALIWYRANKNKFLDWSSIVIALKNEFLPEDYDDVLWEKIRNRTQRGSEPISIYIAIMDTLFRRLSRPPSEMTKLKFLRKLIRPEFIRALALNDLSSVEQLTTLCRKLERAAVNIREDKAAKPKSSALFSVEAKQEPMTRSSTAERTTTVESKPPLICFNCKGLNHTYSNCLQKRKRFCYRCGNPDVTLASCPSCSKKRMRRPAVPDRRRERLNYSINRSAPEWTEWLGKVADFCRPSRVDTLLLRGKGDDRRPHLAVKINGKVIVALLDSGASRSVLGSLGVALLRTSKPIRFTPELKSVQTADGTPHDITAETWVEIDFDATIKKLAVLETPSLPVGLVLGADFCSLFAVKLDFAKQTCSPQITVPQVSSLLPEPCLSAEQSRIADAVAEKFGGISGPRLGRTDQFTFDINTGDSLPFRQYQYPLSPYLSEVLNREVDEMLQLGVLEPSNSPWCSPVLLVKKSSGEYRFCFDGRKLNQVTKHDSYPLPRVERILSSLRDAKYISSIDLRKAFWQIPLSQGSKEKTAFAIPGRGLFQFTVMPFGLRNSAQSLQRLMDVLFGPRFEPHVFVYLDDLIITTPDSESHCALLETVFDRLRAANLTVNIEKSKFFRTSLKYLGYIVTAEGIRTDPDKVDAMIHYPRPTNTSEIKRFIGLCSWYRRFIRDFSSLVAPINDLLKGKGKKKGISWNDQAEQAFIAIKTALMSAPILASPDFGKPFTVQCDASDVGVGGVLTQEIEGVERVISFASRSLSDAERNYSVTERECLAVIFSVEKFRPYLEGISFTVVTDHHSLLYLFRMKTPTGRLARWILRLQQFSFEVTHRKGKFNVVADALSRAVPPILENEEPTVSPVMTLVIEPGERDRWYHRMMERVQARPDAYVGWQIQNGKLLKFRQQRAPLGANVREWKFVVPKSQRTEAIRSCHDVPTAAHFGVFKTVKRLQETYYWPRMRSDVLRYVKSCRTCAAQKWPNQGAFGLMGQEKRVHFPWQVIAIDFMGPFPRTNSGHKYLLVISDWFTKFTLLFPVKKATTKPVIKFLEERVFLTFGVPQFIITDNGKQFISNSFKNFVASYNIRKIWYNAVYHPQVNFVERTNRTIGTAVRSYLDSHDTWDRELPKIQCAINTATHESTGFTPSFLNFGRYVPLSGDYYGDVEPDGEFDYAAADRRDYADDLLQLREVFEEVRQNLRNAYRRQSLRYNATRRDHSFTVGDRVWRRNKTLSSARQRFASKLAPKYVLGTVVEKLSNLVYRIRDADGGGTANWHIKDLKPFYPDQDSGGESTTDSDDTSDVDDSISTSSHDGDEEPRP